MICQENMPCVHFYTYFFYHGYILRDLSHQLLVTGSQLFIFQEHYHLLPLIYLSCIMVGTGSSIFSSLPNPSVISCPAPSVTLRNDGLCEGGRGITWGFFSPLTKGCPKGHQNWHFIQPDVRAQWVEIHVCVLGVAGKCPEKVKQLKAQSYPPPSNPLFRKQKQVSAMKIIFA